MTGSTIAIAGRPLGRDHAPFVVAELSANHLGSLERAMTIMEEAKQAGADALKLQTFTADTITISSDRPEFVIRGGPWDGRCLHNLYDEAATPWAWHEALFRRGRELGIAVFSSPFDPSAVAFLEGLGAPAYKIASFELVDLGLIRCAAATGKPIILSTGMASLAEIHDAVAAVRETGNDQIVLLHCVSSYPTPPEEFRLSRLSRLASEFGVVVGISDHSPGAFIPTGAVALGACVIEKHLTLRRSDGGPDAGFSLEPAELAEVVGSAKLMWSALGKGCDEPAAAEEANRALRRSLYAVMDIPAGAPFTAENVRSIRPAAGLPPKFLPRLLESRAACAIPRGTPLAWHLVAGAREPG